MRQVPIAKQILHRQTVRIRRRARPRSRLPRLVALAFAVGLPVALLRGPDGGGIPTIGDASAAVHAAARPAPSPQAPTPPVSAPPRSAPPPPAVLPPPPAKPPAPHRRPAPRRREISGTLAEGSGLLAALQRAGLERDALFELLDAAGKVIDFRRCRPGDRYRLVVSESGKPLRLDYYGPFDEVLGARRKGGKLVPFREPLQGERGLRVLRGQIGGSLEAAILSAGGTARLAANLADLFAWDLDFNVDPRRGDSFAVAIERVRLPDGSWREGPIAAAEYRGAAGHFRAYRFDVQGVAGYYDARGRPLRRRYLASPLPFVRITSRFGRRWHPILSRMAHHGGVDYAAPTGTPVWSVADGRVQFAGRKGGYGKLVILRHPDGMQTYYAHLSRIAKGVRKGVRIRQKQVIGAVGSTGRSTGPHLHFALRASGRFLDPAKARNGRAAPPLPGPLARRFQVLVRRLDARLRGVPEVAVATSSPARPDRAVP